MMYVCESISEPLSGSCEKQTVPWMIILCKECGPMGKKLVLQGIWREC